MFAVILSIHIIICVFLIILILLQRSEGGGLGIGQAGSSGGLGDYLTARSTSNILTKTTSILAFFFFLTSLSLVFITNSTYDKESIIDSSDDSIIDRLDLIPEEFDVENIPTEENLDVPTE